MVAAAGHDSERVELENLLGCLVGTLQVLRVVCIRINDRMRTADEADDLRALAEAMETLREARDRLAAFHPQALSREKK